MQMDGGLSMNTNFYLFLFKEADRVRIKIPPAWTASTVHNSAVQTLNQHSYSTNQFCALCQDNIRPPSQVVSHHFEWVIIMENWPEPSQTLRLGGPSTVLITAGSSSSCPLPTRSLRLRNFSLRLAGAWGLISTLGLGEEPSGGDGGWCEEGWFPSSNRRSTGSASRSSAFMSVPKFRWVKLTLLWRHHWPNTKNCASWWLHNTRYQNGLKVMITCL